MLPFQGKIPISISTVCLDLKFHRKQLLNTSPKYLKFPVSRFHTNPLLNFRFQVQMCTPQMSTQHITLKKNNFVQLGNEQHIIYEDILKQYEILTLKNI